MNDPVALVFIVAYIAFIASGFIWKQGPCRNCGRKWAFGWMYTNIAGVCSSRCYVDYMLKDKR